MEKNKRHLTQEDKKDLEDFKRQLDEGLEDLREGRVYEL